MVETPDEYQRRLSGYIEGRDPVAMQAEAPSSIAGLIAGVAQEKLKHRPEPGQWCVIEILAHMAEDELVSTWRYRQMLEHPMPELNGFDQDLWAAWGDYATWEAEDALAMFGLLRQANLRMFARLTPDQWLRRGLHRERGPLTVRDLCRHMAAHDINHIGQIRRLVS